MTYPRPFHGHTTAAPATSSMAPTSNTSARIGTSTGNSTTDSTPAAAAPKAKATIRREGRDIRALKTPTPDPQAGTVTVPQSVLPEPFSWLHGNWTRLTDSEGPPADLPDDDDEDEEEPDARHR